MAKKQMKTKSRLGLICVMLVVLLICGFIYFKTTELKNELLVLNSRLDSIQEDINLAKKKQEDLKNEEKYRQTDDYKKDEAKDIYGLRDPDETIFLPNEPEGK